MAAGFLLYMSHDEFGRSIMSGGYDEGETKLVEKLNLCGKVVYDIGAHHGYYSFLFSKFVGNSGKVFAFEPSPRERFYFKISQFLNHSKNISLIPFGLSSKSGKSTFYQAQGIFTGFNSLRPPRFPRGYGAKTKKITVNLITLDNFVTQRNLPLFMKIDAEGAEFSIIKGAKRLIKSNAPLMLMEMADIRSKAWNYKIANFIQYLRRYDYLLYKITEAGYLTRIKKQKIYDDNYFLIPKKLIDKYKYLVKKN
jgi:FkbM family methyltransferase